MAVALFGGTFDPVHNAHMLIASAASRQFGVKVLFMPAARPPHKDGLTSATYAQRARMLELACGDDSRFEVSRAEQQSEGCMAQRSYSILTIEKLLKQGLGPLSFLIGSDAFAEIGSWHRWHDVVRLVSFIVVTRPGAAYTLPEGAAVRELQGIDSAVSSSLIRAAIMKGQRDIQVPGAVLQYIREHRLYEKPPDDSFENKSTPAV